MAWKRPLNSFDDPRNQEKMQEKNPENFNVILDRQLRPPVGLIYIHSVAKRDMYVTHALFASLTLPGCNGKNDKERYVTCISIPDPVPQVSPDLERGGSRLDEHNGWRVAIDILNPANTTNDPWAETSQVALSEGCNLIAQGLFPSHNAIPTEEELKKAEEMRNRRYDWLAQRAIEAESVSTRELNDFLKQHPEAHDAMDALGLAAAWHRPKGVKTICPNCGDLITQGVAFHINSGVVCVLDAARAWKAGAISKERYEELKEAS